MNMDFGVMLSIFEFYLKKLYHKYRNVPIDERIAFENKLANNRIAIDQKVKNRLKAEGNDALTIYYNYLFAVTNTYVEGGTTKTFKGLNGYIEDLINNSDYPNLDFFDALMRFLKNPPSYNSFLQEFTPTSDYDLNDIGIRDFMSYFTLLTGIAGLKLTVEGLIGVSGGGSLKLGGDGLTANLGLDGFAQLTYKGTVFENGTLTDLGINDPLRTVFEQLDRLLARAATGKKVPIRNLLDILE